MKKAHITLHNEKRIEQSLKDHSINTATYAREALECVGFGALGYISGLLHDMGKGTEVFNQYLEKSFEGEETRRGSVNHTFAGVIYVLERYHETIDESQRIISEIIAYAIGAHHGLFDCVSLQDVNGFEHRLHKDKKEIYYNESLDYFLSNITDENEIDSLCRDAVKEFNIFLKKCQERRMNREEQHVMIGYLARMVLSAVIYADRKDTRQFMSQKDDPRFDVDWNREQEFLETKLMSFSKENEINQIRGEISDQCKASAGRSTGVYRLNVPTGGGKTLSALRYSIEHSLVHDKSRIFFVIPLLSILDQNAQVIRENISTPNLVLEHHSNVIKEKDGTDELDDYELLTDTWDSPIIITTLVQLLNTCFSGKTSAVGRFKALVNSTIVIDEIQTLPTKTIFMFNRMVNFLNLFFNTTVVLSSATQPTLGEVDWPIYYAKEPELVSLNADQLSVFKRSEIKNYVDPYGLEIEELADLGKEIIYERDSLLIICNTKNEAKRIYDILKNDNSEYKLYHLSTSMCKAHRMEVLSEIKETLAVVQKQDPSETVERQKIICVATQLVEAGIDFSFETVIRVLAGIDNLAQAAGRCNRSNEYANIGKVYLVRLKNENLQRLPDISLAQKATENTIAGLDFSDDLIGKDSANRFYSNKFRLCKSTSSRKNMMAYNVVINGKEQAMATLYAKNPFVYNAASKKYFLNQPFDFLGKTFTVFDDSTTDIVVPYKDGADIAKKLRTLQNYRVPFEAALDLVKEAKAYTVSVFNIQDMVKSGWVEELFDGRIRVLSESLYDQECGLSMDLRNEANTYYF